MTVPSIVRERLGEEGVTARVPLGGDDELLVTPDRTIIYRAEGLLSGESVEEYPHEAERVSVGEGRRKYTITLDHGIDGQSQFTVPADRFDEAIEPILAGVFTAAGITEPDEEVSDVYRLGELTLVVTDARVVKHVGGALWDEEYEVYPFEEVTAVDVEAGNVSSQIIIEVGGRPQRIKTPTDDARRIRSRIEEGVLAYHDAANYDEFLRSVQAEAEPEASVEEPTTDAPEEPQPRAEPSTDQPTADADPQPTEEASTTDDSSRSGMVFGEGVGTEPVESPEGTENDLADELAALRSAVERQNDLLRRHQQSIERLVRELRGDD